MLHSIRASKPCPGANVRLSLDNSNYSAFLQISSNEARATVRPCANDFEVDYKKNQLPQFIEKMQSLFHEQQEEIQRAGYRRGKWKFCAEFKYLELTEAEWFSTLPKERRHYMETWVQNTFSEDAQIIAVIPVTPSLKSTSYSHGLEPRPTWSVS